MEKLFGGFRIQPPEPPGSSAGAAKRPAHLYLPGAAGMLRLPGKPAAANKNPAQGDKLSSVPGVKKPAAPPHGRQTLHSCVSP
jgi:hypothetical protein